MLIFPRPSSKCGNCRIEDNCSCLCHQENIANGRHYFIRRDITNNKAKPVKDLEHFRNV